PRHHARGRRLVGAHPLPGLLPRRHSVAGDGEMSDPVQVRVRGLHKSFGTHHVLKGIDLDVDRGKINMIIGGSGQGKSVLMKNLMGLLKPDSGQILVDEIDIVPMDDFQLNEIRKKFGLVFQYAALFDSMSVEENVIFPLVEHTKMSREEMLQTAY